MIPAAEAVAQAAARLAAAGIEEPRREARLLVAAALGLDAAGLLATGDVDEAMIEPALARRVAREPMAYILGRREFWGMTFLTSPATLIPRPDSETLIEAALAARPERAVVRRICDLGTGTGCLLLAALREYPAGFGVGVDIGPEATGLAACNAAALGLAERSAFLAGDWDSALATQFDLVLSNPPYIRRPDLTRLMPEVARYEPLAALDGGEDGLAAYRLIMQALPRLLAESGIAVLELGAGQASAVAALAAAAGLSSRTRRDLGGHERAMVLERCK